MENTGYIKDLDCTKDTPVIYGHEDAPIYGQGIRIKPRVPGRQESEHMKKIYLEELLPLEEYDMIAVLLSGGKDSIACYYKLIELGVPKEKIELWHHDIDGGHPSRRMDWRCTQNYVKAFAEAEQVPLRLSWRVNGFFGELYRIGASEPVEWMDPDTGDKSKRLHPTQKPVDLLEYLVKTYTNPGETVLDNCMGAGSTGVACLNTGREFVGIELDPEYYQIAKERIEQHVENIF